MTGEQVALLRELEAMARRRREIHDRLAEIEAEAGKEQAGEQTLVRFDAGFGGWK